MTGASKVIAAPFSKKHTTPRRRFQAGSRMQNLSAFNAQWPESDTNINELEYAISLEQ